MKSQNARKRNRRRKCKSCRELYMPDARHLDDQQYCNKPECRRASKHESQRRWLKSPKGRKYFRGQVGTHRVQQWRKANPGYWRRRAEIPDIALQETRKPQATDSEALTASLNDNALQDMNLSQPALIVGLIASLTGNTLQDTIEESYRRFINLGQDILGTVPGNNPNGGRHDGKADYMPATAS